jgi:hypothetical protein
MLNQSLKSRRDCCPTDRGSGTHYFAGGYQVDASCCGARAVEIAVAQALSIRF